MATAPSCHLYVTHQNVLYRHYILPSSDAFTSMVKFEHYTKEISPRVYYLDLSGYCTFQHLQEELSALDKVLQRKPDKYIPKGGKAIVHRYYPTEARYKHLHRYILTDYDGTILQIVHCLASEYETLASSLEMFTNCISEKYCGGREPIRYIDEISYATVFYLSVDAEISEDIDKLLAAYVGDKCRITNDDCSKETFDEQ